MIKKIIPTKRQPKNTFLSLVIKLIFELPGKEFRGRKMDSKIRRYFFIIATVHYKLGPGHYLISEEKILLCHLASIILHT